MGTHPIFESDFDCLTDCRDWKMHQRRWNEANGFTVAEIKAKLAEWREVFPVNQRSPGKNNKAARSAVVNELLPEIPMREEGGGRRHILRLDMQAEIGVIYQEQDTRKIDTSKLNTTRSRMTTDGSILKENVPMVPAVSAGRDRSSSRASTGTGGGGARSRSGSRVANSQSKPAGRDSARRSTKNVWQAGRASSRNIWADQGEESDGQSTTDEDGKQLARNSMAPNDGFESNKMPEHRQDGRRRSSHRISNQRYGHFASVMLRKKQNPSPNLTDKFSYQVWKKVGYYIPLAAVLSVFDWASDLFGTIEFMGSQDCKIRVFGMMMAITVFITPIAFSFIQPSGDEMLIWEKFFRFILFKGPVSPYERWARPERLVWYPTKVCYHLFAPFTHVISQVKVHVENAEKVDYYTEYAARSAKMESQLHERKFNEVDQKDMIKLAQLQQRATNYVLYYTRFSKSRLKFCLIEDAIQYNIQLINFIIVGFSFAVNEDVYDYTAVNLDSLMDLKPATSFIKTFFVRILMMSTSSLSMWLGIYMTERFHEQLMTGQTPGTIRVLSLALKTFIELVLPTLSMAFLLIYDLQRESGIFGKKILPDDSDRCDDPGQSTEQVLRALILNISNQMYLDWDTTKRTAGTTFKFAIYSAALTIKYSRISGGDEQAVDDRFHFGWKQFGLFLLALGIKITLPVVFIMTFLPDPPVTTARVNFVGLSTSSDMIYNFQFPKHRNLTLEVKEYDLSSKLNGALKEHRQLDFFFSENTNFVWFDVKEKIAALKQKVIDIKIPVCQRIRLNAEHPEIDNTDTAVSNYIGHSYDHCVDNVQWSDSDQLETFKAGHDADDIVRSNDPTVASDETKSEGQWRRTGSNTWMDLPAKCMKGKQATYSEKRMAIDPTIVAPSHYYQANMLEDKRSIVQDWVSQSATICMWSDQFKKEDHRFEFAVVLRACSWFNTAEECNKEKRITIPELVARNSFEDPMRDIRAMEQSKLKYNMINLFQMIQCHLHNDELNKIDSHADPATVQSLREEHELEGQNKFQCGKGFIKRADIDEISSLMMRQSRVHWSTGFIKDRSCVQEGEDFQNCKRTKTPLKSSDDFDTFWHMAGQHDDVASSFECKLENGVVSNHLCQSQVPLTPFVPVGTVENWYDFLQNTYPSSREYAENLRVANETSEATGQRAHKHMRYKFGCYVTIVVFLLMVSLIFAEMNLPIIPDLLRISAFDPMYKSFKPMLLITIGVALLMLDINKSIYEFCAMNPSASSNFIGLETTLGCYQEATYRIRNSDAKQADSVDSKFNAMGRCGVGLRCFDEIRGSMWNKELTDPVYLFNQNKDFSSVENEIKKNTLGQLQAAMTNVWSGKQGQALTCLFNHDLIQRTPVGPRVSPLKCPC